MTQNCTEIFTSSVERMELADFNAKRSKFEEAFGVDRDTENSPVVVQVHEYHDSGRVDATIKVICDKCPTCALAILQSIGIASKKTTCPHKIVI